MAIPTGRSTSYRVRCNFVRITTIHDAKIGFIEVHGYEQSAGIFDTRKRLTIEIVGIEGRCCRLKPLASSL